MKNILFTHRHHSLFFFMVLVLAVFIGSTYLEYGQSNAQVSNALTNPGCETTSAGNVGWQSTVSRVTSPVRTGSGSCLVSLTTGTVYTMEAGGTIANPQVGQQYSGEAYVRASTNNGQPAYLVIRENGGPTANRAVYGPAVNLSTSWQRVSNTFTIQNSGRTSVQMYLLQDLADPGDSFYVDDMIFTAGSLTGVPTPTSAPVPTATPVPTSAPVPTPPTGTTGDISNLNFAITNSFPWMQGVCGDLRMDNGVSNTAPSGQFTIATNTTCGTPGIIFTGDEAASFGQGQSSSSNQVVGGTTYPEVYTPPGTGGIFSSYDYLNEKAQTTDTPPTNLNTRCTLSNCTLPVNLPQGIYYADGDVTLNAYTFPANQHYVFLIDGNLTIRGNIITPVGSSSFFSVSGNIIIPPTVGNAAANTNPNLAGIFSTDRSFIMNSNSNCTDLRLNIAGTLIVNAGRTGGALQNNRDLCGDNPTTPTLQLVQRLDFVLNLPDFVRLQRTTLEEVAP